MLYKDVMTIMKLLLLFQILMSLRTLEAVSGAAPTVLIIQNQTLLTLIRAPLIGTLNIAYQKELV